jgi:hypothetical protein
MSLTLNGVKATIIFHDTTANNPSINWELVIESGNNKASIDGSLINTYFETPTHPSPVAEPVAELIAEPVAELIANNCTACSKEPQKEKKVEKYVDECGYTWPAFVGKSDDEARFLLMKKLFEKEKLVFTPDIMQIYYNSEVQTVRVNRYKKMMLFINAYKNIDGETNYL